MLNSAEIPFAWRELRRQIELDGLGQWNVIIAGGCLRDLVLGIEPKDVDIFITGITLDEAQQLYGANIQNYGSVSSAKHLETTMDGVRVDLIFLPQLLDAWGVIREFDYALCQIAFDGKSVIVTKEFNEDVLRKTLTRTGGWAGPHRDRLAAKFEPLGYTFVEQLEDPLWMFEL